MYADLMDSIGFIAGVDPEVAEAMGTELARQRRNIELIASENIVSPAVMAAMGSVLTNKYAEGYPGKRYYGGCECVDVVEEIARKRACELFGAEHANVQPHSGAQANLAVYFALLQPGDTILGMNLAAGGHLTPGSPANMSGSHYNIVPYGVDDNGFIDYDQLMELAMTHKPKLIVAGASAYPRTIDFAKFREVADACGAYLVPRFFGRSKETVFLLCLDAKCKVLCCKEIGEGSVNAASISVRKVVETALAANATTVILAHNHPSGVAVPSAEDVQTTRRIAAALSAVEIHLADHMVVAEGDYVSMVQSGYRFDDYLLP